ncbi:MDR family MFS transporter [Ktedonosporobacter rubrisoli]|nr:MDR family MFS transporter [Ktedonosporobacter rubrisoli]
MTDRSPVLSENEDIEAQHPRGWRLAALVGGLLLTLALSALDATIVGTALPAIVKALHGFAEYSWVVTAYLLTSTTVVPIVGKLSDQFGRKGFVLTGIALFLLGSALAGTAQSMTQLILFRGLQGLGAGFMQTLVFTLIADLFPPAERGRWQGLFASILSLVLIVAPALGGWITDHEGWRWVFYINMPVGILALLVLTIWLPSRLSTSHRAYSGWKAWRRIDFAGALTSAVATICLLLALTWAGTTYAWGSPQVIGLLGAATILYLTFFAIERRVSEPLLPLDLFRSQIFSASSLLALVLGMIIYAMIFYLPLFMQTILGQAATNSGASLAPLFLPIAISAIIGGQLISKVGRYHLLAIIGALILLLGLFLLVRMDTMTTLLTVTINMIIVGLGIGVLQPIYTIAGQNATPVERLGTGTGAINYLRAMGSLLGTAVLGVLATGSHATGLSLAARQALAQNLGHVFLVTFGVGVAALVITLFLKDIPLRKRRQSTPTAISEEKVQQPHINGSSQ